MHSCTALSNYFNNNHLFSHNYILSIIVKYKKNFETSQNEAIYQLVSYLS